MGNVINKYDDIIKICKQAQADILRITHDPDLPRVDKNDEIRQVVARTDQKIKSYFNVYN